MENHDGEEILPRPPIAVLDVESDHLQSLIHIQELALLDWDPRPGVIDMEQGLQVVVLCEFSSIFPEHRIPLDSAIATIALRRNIIILQELAVTVPFIINLQRPAQRSSAAQGRAGSAGPRRSGTGAGGAGPRWDSEGRVFSGVGPRQGGMGAGGAGTRRGGTGAHMHFR